MDMMTKDGFEIPYMKKFIETHGLLSENDHIIRTNQLDKYVNPLRKVKQMYRGKKEQRLQKTQSVKVIDKHEDEEIKRVAPKRTNMQWN